MIVGRYEPLSFVEDPDLKAYTAALCPSANIPCKKVVKELLEVRQREYEICIGAVCTGQWEAITSDMFTSCGHHTYYSFTRQHINDNWEMVPLSLECVKHTGHTTGADLAKLISGCIERHGMNVIAAVTDTEPSMVAAGRELSERGFAHIGCTNHRLELITGVVYKQPDVAAALKVSRAIVGHFNSSTQAQQLLINACEGLGLKFKSLKQDVNTRWWSTTTQVTQTWPSR
jgi:hypothetical protein